MAVEETDSASRSSAAINSAERVGAQDVRQGRPGMRILWVLVVSLVLVILALLGLWMSHAHQLAATAPNAGGTAADAAAFQKAPGAAKQNPPAGAPNGNDAQPQDAR